MSLLQFEDERAETPQDFVYKTKIVVLNYLGIGPPDFDIQSTDSFSDTCSSGHISPVEDFEPDLPSSEQEIVIKISSEEQNVKSLESSQEDVPITNTLQENSRQMIDVKQSVEDVDSSSGSEVKLNFLRVGPRRSKSKSPLPQRRVKSRTGSHDGGKNLPGIQIERDIQGRSKSPLKRRSTLELHEQYQNTLRELMTNVHETRIYNAENQQEKIGMHEVYQRALAELIQSMQKDDERQYSPNITPEVSQGAEFKMHDEFRQAMTELRVKIKKAQANEGGLDQFCAISREALVAERIAQIGDKIMESHGPQLEQALRTVMISNSGQITYSLFKAVLKETIKAHAPGWYHVAVAMNFTRHLAFGLISNGNKGFEIVTDFAIKYIEENLAQTILDQGGWDAITCINLDELDEDMLSEISSGHGTPYSLDSLSLNSVSPCMPSSPLPRVNGSNQHTEVNSGSAVQRRGLILNIPSSRCYRKKDGNENEQTVQEETSKEAASVVAVDGPSSLAMEDNGGLSAGEDEEVEEDAKVEEGANETEVNSSSGWLGTAAVSAAVAAGVTAGVIALMKR